jgi:arabinan endo-1,5-alpha-L-arabinosidase
MKYFLVIHFILFSLDNCLSQSAYTNPVYANDFADPTVIRAADGWFYAYGTNTSVDNKFYHIQVAKSLDLVHWVIVGDALPSKPLWADKDFWAPHVLYDSSLQQYYLYYSGESPDEQIGKCIGVAVSKKPEGPFIDIGTPLISGQSFINIDPMAFDDPATGKKYLYWGSAHLPIKIRELNNDRISFRDGSTTTDIISPNKDDYSKLIEGAWIHYRDDYYYLFYSGDNCCGDKAHYAVMVARSKKAEGPFERLSHAKKSNSSAILVANEKWLAPGHNSVITDNAGQDWIIYHAISRDHDLKSRGRIMLIDRIQYKDEWPVIETNSPGIKASSIPIIKNNNSK